MRAGRRSGILPSSSPRSGGNSTDSASEARDVRLEEAPEARLAGRLPGNRLIQWSHRDELVEPAAERETELEPAALKLRRTGGRGDRPATELLADQEGTAVLR